MWFRLISDGGIVGSSWQPATVIPAAAFQELYVEPSLNIHLGDLRKVKSQRWRDANPKPNSSTNDHDNWPWLNRRLRSRKFITTEANSPIKRPAFRTKTYWRPSAVMVSKHNNEPFWNGCEIFTWTSLVNTQKSEPESPGNMATNVINFKVGFTKIKSRQQVHQNGRLQQINVQHAKTHYHIIYPLQFNADCANVTVSQHSPLSRGSGLRDCSLFLTWIRIRQRQQ